VASRRRKKRKEARQDLTLSTSSDAKTKQESRFSRESKKKKKKKKKKKTVGSKARKFSNRERERGSQVALISGGSSAEVPVLGSEGEATCKVENSRRSAEREKCGVRSKKKKRESK
jgi:hypothetical protein